MSRNRSWVNGRAGLTPCCSYAMAVASTAPIQIGRYRSPSTSLSRTIGWLLGSSTRTPTTLRSPPARLRVARRSRPVRPPPPRRATRPSGCFPPILHGTRTLGTERHTMPVSGAYPGNDRRTACRVSASASVAQARPHQGRVQPLGQRLQLARRLRGARPRRRVVLAHQRRQQLREETHLAVRAGPEA